MSLWWKIGALSGMSAVFLGAFGSHALRNRASPRDLEVWETGCRYQMYHSLALLFASHKSALSSKLFLTGIVLFSGSLYLLVLTGEKKLGIVTPFGGLSLAAGWCALAFM